MSENEMKKINEKDLGNIILCDPITDRGKEALEELKLKEVVTENYFLDNLYIPPKYYERQSADITDEQSAYINKKECLQYNYSVTNKIFKDRKDKLEYFDAKFTSDAINQSPLNILGSPGIGKSIEAYAKIRKLQGNNKKIATNYIIYNLESSFTELTRGITYRLDEKNKENVLWLIFMVLLENIYNLATKDSNNFLRIACNHKKYFENKNISNDAENKIFSYIKKYRPRNKKRIGKELFENICKLIDKNNICKTIEDVLKITMNLLYCINPENKNYIIFDNLEHHIKLNPQNIVIIHNSELSELYKYVEEVINNLTKIYDQIKNDEFWRAFKIIIVMRRTTGHLIGKTSEHYATKFLGMGNDYTGHFDIWRIWEKKKEYIWEKHLKERYDIKRSSEVFHIINDMMNDNPIAKGKNYQELISPLMNSGIRRNGRAQAHATMDVYDIITRNNNCYINYDTYKDLLKKENEEEKPMIRYMYRRALLEIQYKWMIIPDEARARFEKLLFGKLLEEKETNIKDINGVNIKMRNVLLDDIDKNNTTLVRRILSYLSNFIDNSTYEEESIKVSFRTEMFATKSLYDLMKCIFLNPSDKTTKELEYNEHFLSLAKVLISLANMSHSATKSAPFVILDINDPQIKSIDSDGPIADILKKIWDAGIEKGSVNDNDNYNYTNYGVRLTEAGHVFLCDIQPSFSFFAALYCSEEVPLFFLKDIERIKFVIKSIYKEASDLCKVYEDAAHSFCGSNNTLRTDNYLPKFNNDYITFRHRVKELHSRHLELYIDYIEKNFDILGLKDVKSDLIKFINSTISDYNKWETGKEIVNCF